MSHENTPKIHLGDYPTPLEKLDNLTKMLGKGQLYIKRDDRTGPAFGGNKIRKLEYLFRDALDQGCTAVMTFGGPQTNHGRATVGAAVKLGLKPILVLLGFDNGYLSGNLNLDAMMGADIYFVRDRERMEEAAGMVTEKYEKQGDKVYLIPVGGSNSLGALGYVMAVREMLDQAKEKAYQIDHVVCAAGSLGTYCGLLMGAKYYGAPFDVIGVPVLPVPPDEMRAMIMNLCGEINQFNGMGVTVTQADIKIAYGPEAMPFSGKQYNEPDSETRKYIIKMAKSEGIMLDPTYTGKAFRGFVEMIEAGDWIKPEESALFLHTGGAMALWTKEHLDDMQQQLRDSCSITELF